jgi:hypothetical protein
VANGLQGMQDRLTQTLGAGAVALQQMIGHALRGFRPNARQAAQGFDQRLKPRWIHEFRTGA